MNILIIGNGFDLAHKLPTKYGQFLDFIKFINDLVISQGKASKLNPEEELEFSKLDKGVQNYLDEVLNGEDRQINENNIISKDTGVRLKYIENMIELSKNNLWVKWFQINTEIDSNWIDFEAEISRVVQTVEKIIKQPHRSSEEQSVFIANLVSVFLDDLIYSKNEETDKLDKFKTRTLNDLNNLIKCFEIYLEDCVRKIDKGVLSPDIYDLKVDCLLSFNYTDTYQRLYSCKNSNIEYDYIHGKSKIDYKDPNNMVLGIDDYLTGEERFSNTNFVEFKKYYQRLYKKTGCKYKKWIEDKNKTHDVYIFGHSLAMTDKDVLSEFINKPNTRIIIYYFNNEQYRQQIINLIHMIGPDKLNEMVYGANPKIVFRVQSEMVSIKDTEWSILNDRNKLWNIYNLGDVEIKKLLTRIKNKLEKPDMKYFHDQKNVISLYNALVSTCRRDFKLRDSFLRVAKDLYGPNQQICFSPYDWGNYDFTGHYECDTMTETFIDEINEYNKLQFAMNKNTGTDKLDVLLANQNIAELSQEHIIDLFNSIFKKFESAENNCNTIWHEIYELRKLCPEFNWGDFIEKQYSSSSSPFEKIRYNHLLEIIAEDNYYQRQAEEQLEYENDQDMYSYN